MAKLVTTDLVSLANQTAAVNSINNNFAATEVAMEKTLSRDGTSPNAMGANLDMNSYKILNLADPISDQEPATKSYVDDLIDLIVTGSGGTIIITDNRINVQSYGAVGNGITDDTLAIQAAVTANPGKELWFPAGTYISDGVDGVSNIQLTGDGIGRTIIKRKANAIDNYLLAFTTKNSFHIKGIEFDGNKANQTIPGHNIVFSGSEGYVLEYCQSHSALSTGASYGAGLVVDTGTNDTSNNQGSVRFNIFELNDTYGMLLDSDWNIDIHDNVMRSNTLDGFIAINFDFPPVANVMNQLSVQDNHCLLNGSSGIEFTGYYTGGTAGDLIYGPSVPPSQFVIIAGNICNNNAHYGLGFQGTNATISNNVCMNNGGVDVTFGGILANGQYLTVEGNVCYDNSQYGIDAGGSYQSVIDGNVLTRNGQTSNSNGTQLNVGGSIGTIVSNNTIVVAPVSGSTGIYGPGLDGDGSSVFEWIGSNVTIIGNTIDLLGQAGATGIWLHKNFKGATVHNNVVHNAAANDDAFVLQIEGCDVKGNRDTYWLASAGSVDAISVSASTTVIPDYAEFVYVTGTTNIDSVMTVSQNAFHQKVRDVLMTNLGSGYTSAPAVGFSGGGGSGAAATAQLTNDGKIAGVVMTNHGSGYTSAPTVGFTGGGGSAAAGTALVGCANANGREVTLLLTGALTANYATGNLVIRGPLVTGGVQSVPFKLRGAFGNWYEEARGGTVGPSMIDSNLTHFLTLNTTSNLTAARTLTLVPGDVSRTLTLSGNPTLSDWFDQSVKTTATPTFAGLTIAGTDTVRAITVSGATKGLRIVPTSSGVQMEGVDNTGVLSYQSLFVGGADLNFTVSNVLKGLLTTAAMTWTGVKNVFAAATTSIASFNIPAGTAPSSPVDGDVWSEANTDNGLKYRVNSLTRTIPVATTNGAWTAYTPTVTASTGTITTVTGNTGAWVQIGKTVHFSAQATITTNGTGAGSLIFTLPVNVRTTNVAFGNGRNATTGGWCFWGDIVTGSNVYIQSSGGAYPVNSGDVIMISGSYEAA